MIKRYLVAFAILLSFSTSYAQAPLNSFITKWALPAGTTTTATELRFNAQIGATAYSTGGIIYYTWTTATNSGSGNLPTTAFANVGIPVILAPGETLTLEITDVQNLARFALGGLPAPAATSNLWLVDVVQWGEAPWTSMRSAFADAQNLVSISATDIPNLAFATSTREMFYNATSLMGVNRIGEWNMTTITDMRAMFSFATKFNQDISNWNVANVTTMREMFYGAASFNQGIGNWSVSKVTDMREMFRDAAQFNRDISAWNTGNVTTMREMFFNAGKFDQNLGGWNVSKVTDMREMFRATPFNQDISGWNVSNVTDMREMFFGTSKFNRSLAAWNVANVTTMEAMFYSAAAFNQSLSTWNLSKITSVLNMLSLSGLNCFNYSNTLIGWAGAATTPSALGLGADNLKYNTAAQSYRSTLTGTKGWTITGDTYDPACPESTTLPVGFSYFAASKQDNNVLLQWATEFEQDNTGFEVLRSVDGRNWAKIGFVATQAPLGNSSSTLTYNFTDRSPYAGINQYRLKQTDADGKYGYSEIRVVNLSNAITTRFYPNPVGEVLIIEGLTGKNKAEVLNAAGQTVTSKILVNTNGLNTLDFSRLSRGIYFVKITSAEGESIVQKILKD